jgi:gliding motility-associated-like protein
MKAHAFFVLSTLFFFLPASAQVICVQCFDQNTPITTSVSNYIVNGGFEINTCTSSEIFCPSSSSYACDINRWVCTNGGSYTYSQMFTTFSSAIVQGSVAAYMGNYFTTGLCSASNLSRACIYKDGCVVKGIPNGFPMNDAMYGGNAGVSLHQIVNGLTPGNTYVLEFWAGGEDYSYFSEEGIFAIDLGFGNMFLNCPPTDLGDIGRRFVIIFRATSASHKIKFTNWGHICTTCSEVILDDVKLYTLDQLPNAISHCDVLPPDPGPKPINNLFIPNLFTPNGDALNDQFEIVYTGNEDYLLMVYNRWGALVFESKDKNILWDGSLNGHESSDGIYYYSLTIGEDKHTGWVQKLK